MASLKLNVNYKLLSEVILDHRNRRSLSQEQLAYMANLSLRTIQRLEKTGKCSPETLLAVADVFEVDVQEFTTLLYEPTTQPMKPINPVHARKNLIKTGIAYLFLLVLITGLLGFFFYDHYFIADRNMIENQDPYLFYVRLSGWVLIIFLALITIYTGIIYKWYYGLLVVAIGLFVSIACFALLPWIYFPYDQYSAAAIWIFQGMPVMAAIWLASTLLLKFLMTPVEQVPTQ